MIKKENLKALTLLTKYVKDNFKIKKTNVPKEWTWELLMKKEMKDERK